MTSHDMIIQGLRDRAGAKQEKPDIKTGMRDSAAVEERSVSMIAAGLRARGIGPVDVMVDDDNQDGDQDGDQDEKAKEQAAKNAIELSLIGDMLIDPDTNPDSWKGY